MRRRSATTTPSCAASSPSSTTPRGSFARSPTATRTPSRPAPHASRRGRATPTALRQTIEKSAPTLRRSASARSASSARSSPHLRGCLAVAAPRAERLPRTLPRDHPRARDRASGAQAHAGRSTRSCARRSARSDELVRDPGARPSRCAALTRHRRHPQPAAPLRRALRHGLQLLQLLLDARRRAPHRARPDRHARSARCSTRRRAPADPRGLDSARSARRPRPTARTCSRRAAALHLQQLLGRGRPRRATPTASPASAATSSAHATLDPPERQDRHRPAHPGQPGDDASPAARACPSGQTFTAPTPRDAAELVPSCAAPEHPVSAAAPTSALGPDRAGRHHRRRATSASRRQPVRRPLRVQGGVRRRPTTSSRARRCASPASTSARSPTSSAARPDRRAS